MKINITQRLDADPNMIDLLKRMAYQINGLSEGSITAKYNSLIAPPTNGKWARGDEIVNSQPSELGAAGSKYIIRSWICTVGGEPGTWKQARVLTGS